MTFRFEKLDVWHKSVEFADLVYEVTREFPADERFGLTNQMRRAAVSVSSNIAEGLGRSSSREKIRFVEMAYGSLLEVVSQSHIAFRQQMLWLEKFEEVKRIADDVARMLSGFRTRLQNGE